MPWALGSGGASISCRRRGGVSELQSSVWCGLIRVRGRISLTRAQCFPQCPHQTVSCPEDISTSCSGPFSGPASTLLVLSRSVLSNSLRPHRLGPHAAAQALMACLPGTRFGTSADPHEAPGYTYPCPLLHVPFLTTLSGFLCSHSLLTIPCVFPGMAEWEPPNAGCRLCTKSLNQCLGPPPVPGGSAACTWHRWAPGGAHLATFEKRNLCVD